MPPFAIWLVIKMPFPLREKKRRNLHKGILTGPWPREKKLGGYERQIGPLGE